MSRGHRAAAVAVASGFYRQDKVRGLSRMATTLWDSPFNGLAHREVAVNDEGNGCHAIDGNPCDGFGCDVLPTVADYLVRDHGAHYVVPVLRGGSPVLESELPEPPV